MWSEIFSFATFPQKFLLTSYQNIGVEFFNFLVARMFHFEILVTDVMRYVVCNSLFVTKYAFFSAKKLFYLKEKENSPTPLAETGEA